MLRSTISRTRLPVSIASARSSQYFRQSFTNAASAKNADSKSPATSSVAEQNSPHSTDASASPQIVVRSNKKIIERALHKDNCVIVNRATGGRLSINPVFLRDLCQCPKCVDPLTKQKRFETASIPLDIKIKRLDVFKTLDGVIELSITWSNDIWPNHDTRLPFHFVEDALSNTVEKRSTGVPRPWSASQMRGIKDRGENTASFDAFVSEEETFTRILAQLRDHGLAFIESVPHSEKAVEQLGERIAPLRHTFYGRTWDVRNKPDAENVAYTADKLGLHMDLLYMKQPPGLQLLHCLTESVEGGESLFADSFAAAGDLWRRGAPGKDAFDALATFPVSYHYHAPGRAFFDTKPTFELESHHHQNHQTYDSNDQSRPNFVIPPRIANINWSPPFQAPFTVDTGSDDDGRRLQRYHAAAQAFSVLINSRERLYTYRLKPGECVIFNNRRVLHGRAAFTSGNAERFLKGAYVDTDDFNSQLRQRGLHKSP